MKAGVFFILLFLLAGCASPDVSKPPPPSSSVAVGQASGAKILPPEVLQVGKVVRYNPDGRTAILSFPIGQMPKLGSRLGVYRQGNKIGTLRLTGPQMDYFVAGDMLSGEAGAGDEVGTE